MASYLNASTTRIFLYGIVVSIAVAALIAVFPFLVSDYDRYQVRIVMTAVAITGATICGLCCAALLGRRRAVALSLGGMVLAFSAAAMGVLGIWADIGSEAYGKAIACVIIWSIALAHMCLLLLLRLAPRFLWVLVVACLAGCGLAAIMSGMILAVPDHAFGGLWRAAGALAVIACAASIAAVILHKLSSSPAAGAAGAGPVGDNAIGVLCPRCGAKQTCPPGRITCGKCRCQFVLEIIDESSTPCAGAPCDSSNMPPRA